MLQGHGATIRVVAVREKPTALARQGQAQGWPDMAGLWLEYEASANTFVSFCSILLREKRQVSWFAAFRCAKHGRGAVAYIVTEQMQQIKPCGHSPGEGLQTPAGSFLRSCGCQTTSKPQAAILNNRQLRVTKRAVCSSLWAVSQEMTEDGCCDIWPLKSWGPCPPPS